MGHSREMLGRVLGEQKQERGEEKNKMQETLMGE